MLCAAAPRPWVPRSLAFCVGNLYVKLHVSDHPVFKRRGADVHTEVPITIAQAVLGCSLSIPALSGEVEVQVPAGTQPDTSLVMRGRGIVNPQGSDKGHHYIKLKLEVPRSLSARQQELMEEFLREEEQEGGGASQSQ